MFLKSIFVITFLFSLFTVGFTQTGLQYASYQTIEEGILNDVEEIVVLNFWATWCKPCVEELPDFEKIQLELKDKNVQVILANLDFHSKTEPVVQEFILKKNIQSTVVHITDQDANDWVTKVDTQWSGSIPATAIYNKGKKVWFFEGQTDYATLKSIIIKYLPQ